MKRIMFFLAVIILFATNLFSQELTEVYNIIWDRTEYYNEKNVLVMFSIKDNFNHNMIFYNAKGEIVDPYDYKIKKNEKQESTRKKKRFVLFENWGKNSDKSVLNRKGGTSEEDGLMYIYSNGRVKGVRFYDICRDRDDFTPGP